MSDSVRGVPSVDWAIVDRSFLPDATALEAVREDVLDPWHAAGPRTLSGRFQNGGTKRWTRTIATPLDGDIQATLTVARGSRYDLSFLASDGDVLASGTSTGRETVRLRICGQRSLRLQVTRHGRAGGFKIDVTQP